MVRSLVCGVDVGTGSARAGLFDRDGRMLARAEHPIAIRRPLPEQAEHNSEDIWDAVCTAVRQARQQVGAGADDVAGIAFDATCSLVVRDRNGAPVSIARDGAEGWDTMVWLDHRAMAEADECTETGHRVLDYLGGRMSPEMQTPKLMWLKRNLPERWLEMGYVFDLSDFLAWKATGAATRSQNTLTCKWTYLPHAGGWQRDFFEKLGLDDLLGRGALPDNVSPVGAPIAHLTAEAADALGLDTGCMVATGMIDAFAGALGVIGGQAGAEAGRHMAMIAGTSSCVMTISAQEIRTPGMWGPYLGAALPDLWISEAGQSATGALLDHIIRLHGAGGTPDRAMTARIVARIGELRQADPRFGAGLNVLPDFHGNRSPLGDPHARGVVSGLSMDSSFDGLCALYWRTSVGIALGVRHIIEHLDANGHHPEMLHVTGGHTRNPLLMELYADATGVAVATCEAEDAVLLGTAMAAATGAGWFTALPAACRAMRSRQTLVAANPERRAGYDADYSVFLAMQRHQKELRDLQ